MANELPPLPTPAAHGRLGYSHGLTRSLSIEVPHTHVFDHELWPNPYPSDDGFPGFHSAMNYSGYPPQARYINDMGGEAPPHLTTGLAEHPGDQSRRSGPPGLAVSQQNQIASGPPRLEYHAQMAPDVPNDAPSTPAPLPYNIAGPSEGNVIPVHSEIPPAEDLKRLATHYINNPDSHVDKLRMWHRRSGGFKVLILLEVDGLNAT